MCGKEKKPMKRKHVLGLVVMAVMLAAVALPLGLPGFAEAGGSELDVDISQGDITLEAGEEDYDGMIEVTHGSLGVTSHVYAEQEIRITGSTEEYGVVVDGVTAKITVDGVNIGSDNAAFELKNGADVTLTLTEPSTLASGYRAGLHVPSESILTISADSTGSLTAIGGERAAGIGGGPYGDGGTITISGGTVTAIGGCYTASDNHGGAGIGGGPYGDGGIITISGGTVTATGGETAAGIGGGGTGGAGGTITISGGTVSATGGLGAAGIGGGYNGAGGTITIDSSATVRAASNNQHRPAVDAAGGSLENASTAAVLMANFSDPVNAAVTTAVYGKETGTLASDFAPTVDYQSIAFTVETDKTYYLNTDDVYQQHSEPPLCEFGIAGAGLSTFDHVQKNTVILDQSAPEGLAGVAPTSPANDNGKITGTTTAMEYKLAADTDYLPAMEPVITGLATGTYHVRYKEKPGRNAGAAAEVTVPAYVAPPSPGGGSSRPATGTSKEIKAAAGGTVSFAGVTVIIPAGALPADAIFSIKKLTQSETEKITPEALCLKLGSTVYEITTTGDRDFDPHTITIKMVYDPAKIAASEVPVINYYDEETGEWTALMTAVEQGPDGKWYAVVTVSHLTRFAVFSTAVEDSGPEPVPPVRTIRLTIGFTRADIDGTPYTLDAAPFLDAEAGRTLVPLRFISDALGADVDWDAATRQVTVNDAGKEIILTIGAQDVFVNGQTTTIEASPVILPPGRTFVPLRFVSETLGAVVGWDAATREITIQREERGASTIHQQPPAES